MVPEESRAGAARHGIFVKRGDYWTIGYRGEVITLRDARGLAHIQRLLQHPNQLFHALDLAGGAEGATSADLALDEEESEFLGRAGEERLAEAGMHRGGLGDAGEMLDAEAKSVYRRRLAELQQRLDEAKEAGDTALGASIEDEIDALVRELKRAVGLGGRDRMASSASERARINVSRTIKAAIAKIGAQQVEFGALLTRTIRTGTFCRYSPDPQASVAWQFSASEQPGAGEGMWEPLSAAAPAQAPVDGFPFALSDRTTFVGRDKERDQLRACLRQAQSGRGGIVMISGAAGVGKTRLAEEVAQEAWQDDVRTLVGRCYDVVDSLPYGPFVEVLEAMLAPLPPDSVRQVLGEDAPEIARLLPQLRRQFPDIPPPVELAPEQSRRLLFNAVASLLARATETAPVLLLLDDLHWADRGSLQLLNHLAQQLPKLRMLIVGAYRDFELDPAGPLAATLDQLIRFHLVEQVKLGGLPTSAVTAMLRELSGREVPARLAGLFYAYTEGNPFFVEELARHLIEQGKLDEPVGQFRPTLELSAEDVPQAVDLVVGRRLARLGEDTQKILGVAAVIGRSFSFDLLQAATGSERDWLLDSVEEAERAGLIAAILQHGGARFQFPHELVRQTALRRLSVLRRCRLHLDVAEAIERVHEGALEEHAIDLANHLSQAGDWADPGRTVRYLSLAARRELEQSAYESALRHLQNGLELLGRLPDSRVRAQQELELQMERGVALVVTRGWYVREVGDAYERARVLAQQLGEDARLFSVAYGLFSFHLVRAEHPTALTYTETMLELGQRAQDDAMLVQAHWASGCSRFFMGELSAAHASFEQGIRRYDRQKHSTLRSLAGQDPCVSCLCLDAIALWLLGYPDRAEKRANEALALARELKHPFTLAWSLSMIAKYYAMRRDYRAVYAETGEGIPLAGEYGFEFFEDILIAYRSIALAAQGRLDNLRQASRGRKKIAEAEYELGGTWNCPALAEALGNLGQLKTASALLAQAREMTERNQERYAEPEIHRIEGELALSQLKGRSCTAGEIESARATAEQSFRHAIEIARRRGAKMLELRAAISLGRLLIEGGMTIEAQGVLEETLAFFTEGFGTPELTAAKALLDSLGANPPA